MSFEDAELSVYELLKQYAERAKGGRVDKLDQNA